MLRSCLVAFILVLAGCSDDSVEQTQTTMADPTTESSTDTAFTGPTMTMEECSDVAECPAFACRRAVDCAAGVCVYEDLPEGTVLDEQVTGDCALAVCDGAGKVQGRAQDDDLPDDAIGCTVDTCEGGDPVFTLMQEACYTGPASTLGVGICAGGTRTCDVRTGEFGACTGEVVPADEVCDPAQLDEDCDGADPVPCCGDGVMSGGEGCDDGDTVDNGCSSSCTEQRVLELSPGGSHACAILTGGIVKCWGNGDRGRLGLGDVELRGDMPGEMGEKLPAVDLGVGQVAAEISAGVEHTCALLAGGRIKCWGSNLDGQLGLGDSKDRGDAPGEMGDALPFVDLGQGVKATAVTAGYFHTCALLAGGAIKCWGGNSCGYLGIGDTFSRGRQPGQMGDMLPSVDLGPGAVAVAVAAGGLHTCALLKGGGVKCWGANDEGALGLGDVGCRGTSPAQMGAALPFVDLGASVAAISVGDGHNCVLLDGGSVKCWGDNYGGYLGLGDTESRGDEPGEMGAMLAAVDLGAGKMAAAVHAYGDHTCAWLSDDTVKCWGDNLNGGLGLGDTESRGDEPGEMGDALPVLDFGAGLVAMPPGESFSYSFSCVRLNDGSVKCWGTNEVGSLGLGDTERHGDEPGEMGDALPRVRLFSPAW